MKSAMHIIKERNSKREAIGDFFVITCWKKKKKDDSGNVKEILIDWCATVSGKKRSEPLAMLKCE